MDIETIRAYDDGAGDFAVEWEETQDPPDDIRAAVREYFVPGPTVDVGCGSGRDTAWLAETGFNVLGVDASAGLIAEAQARHPGARFAIDTLPELTTLQSGAYQNVLCETVIMHLERSLIADAVHRLASLLASGGVLYLTWRVAEGKDRRDEAGRLYSAFSPSLVLNALDGLEIKLDEQQTSASSGKIIHRIVACDQSSPNP